MGQKTCHSGNVGTQFPDIVVVRGVKRVEFGHEIGHVGQLACCLCGDQAGHHAQFNNVLQAPYHTSPVISIIYHSSGKVEIADVYLFRSAAEETRALKLAGLGQRLTGAIIDQCVVDRYGEKFPFPTR